MRTIVGVTICLCGLGLGGCGNLAGMTAGAPERVSVVEPRSRSSVPPFSLMPSRYQPPEALVAPSRDQSDHPEPR